MINEENKAKPKPKKLNDKIEEKGSSKDNEIVKRIYLKNNIATTHMILKPLGEVKGERGDAKTGCQENKDEWTANLSITPKQRANKVPFSQNIHNRDLILCTWYSGTSTTKMTANTLLCMRPLFSATGLVWSWHRLEPSAAGLVAWRPRKPMCMTRPT